jgi:hypothetical protein
MDTQDTTGQDNAVVPTESSISGEPEVTSESTTVEGESGKEASAKREPSSEGLFDGMDGATLHKSYKSLQGQYTKVNEAIKKLERFGGPDQISQWAEYLSNNPRFAEWVQKEQSSKVTGLNEDEMDETTRKAYETVRKIADNTADQKVQAILRNEIAPIAEEFKKQLLNTHFKSMDDKYGKDWHELRDTMSELSADLPARVQNRPTLDDIEDLYFKALRRTGKFDAFAAGQYQKKLTEKKARSTDKPSSAAPSAPRQYKTIQEAFADAKRQANM